MSSKERRIFSVATLLTMSNCLALSCALASDWLEDGNQSIPAGGRQAKTQAPGSLLQGKIEHSVRLPSLGDGLSAGANFDSKNLPRASFASNWFKIPPWFAGTFQIDESKLLSVFDYATGSSSKPGKTVASFGQEQHGHQRDARGDIWHFYVESGTSSSRQDGQITYNTVDWYGPESVSARQVVIRVLATSLIVDKATGVIVDSYRREDIKTYEPLNSDTVKVSYTSKSFDSRGNPRDLQACVSVHRRLAPFQPVDLAGQTDYRLLFRDYLLAHHHEELLPPASR